MVRRGLVMAVVAACALLLAACAAGPNTAANVPGQEQAGFWLGLWQGFISPIAFIVSLFNDNVNIYEVHNNGNWYNFGFMLGVLIVFSGSGGGSGQAVRSRRR
jgi:hypothetical protein